MDKIESYGLGKLIKTGVQFKYLYGSLIKTVTHFLEQFANLGI